MKKEEMEEEGGRRRKGPISNAFRLGFRLKGLDMRSGQDLILDAGIWAAERVL